MKRKIVCNRAKCNNCGDVIISRYRHDFVKCTCGDIFVYGGNEYLRRGYKFSSGIEEMSVYNDAQFEEIREVFARYDNITEEYVPLKDMSDEWLDALMEYYLPPDGLAQMDDDYLLLFLQEKQLRNEMEYC